MIIKRTVGNIGPYSRIEVKDEGLYCWRADWELPDFYAYTVLGAYTISESDVEAPESLGTGETLEQALDRINREFEAELEDVRNAYPQTEREGWAQQQEEAEAYIADSSTLTPLLDAMVAVTGEEKMALALAIKGKVAAYKYLYGAALGRKRMKVAALYENP